MDARPPEPRARAEAPARTGVARTGVAPPARPAARRRRARARTGRLAHLRVVPTPEGPHVRLGVAWFAATVVAVLGGPTVVAAWMVLHAAMAGVQVARSARLPTDPPAVAAVLPVAGAAFGPVGAAAGLAVGAAAAVALATRTPAPPRALARAALPVAAACTSVVLARHLGPAPALALVCLASAHDAGNYVVGTGANNAWEGPAAAAASVAAVALAVAAVLSPPIQGAGPWVLGALAAVLCPLGPLAGSALLGERPTRVPAVRRVDALLLFGPAGLAVAYATVR